MACTGSRRRCGWPSATGASTWSYRASRPNACRRRAMTSTRKSRRLMHGMLDNEMHAAEISGRNSYEFPGMPWDFHIDMARVVWDEIRHSEETMKHLEDLGGRGGHVPRGAGQLRLSHPARPAASVAGPASARRAAWAERSAQESQHVPRDGRRDRRRHVRLHPGRRDTPRGDRQPLGEVVAARRSSTCWPSSARRSSNNASATMRTSGRWSSRPSANRPRRRSRPWPRARSRSTSCRCASPASVTRRSTPWSRRAAVTPRSNRPRAVGTCYRTGLPRTRTRSWRG